MFGFLKKKKHQNKDSDLHLIATECISLPLYDTVVKVKVPPGQLPIIVYVKDIKGNYKPICLNPDTNCYTKK